MQLAHMPEVQVPPQDDGDILKKIERRKSLHFNITSSAHSAVRIKCFQHSITMQDFFEEISQLVESDSTIINTIMESVAEKKKSRKIKKLTETDVDSLYTMIEREIGEK